MKKAILLILVCLTVAGAVSIIAIGEYKNNRSKEKTPYCSSSIFDLNDLNKCVGFVDYVFSGHIEREAGMSYRVNETYYPIGENPSAETSFWYKKYEITVTENIKGTLQTEMSIEVIKDVMISKTTKEITLLEGDIMPEEGKDYVFLCNAHKDGKLVIVAPVGNIPLSEDTKEDTIQSYKTAFENEEVVYERPRYKASYDISAEETQ